MSQCESSVFDNIAQVLSSYLNGLKKRKPLHIKQVETQENIDPNEFQIHANLEIVNIKYLVFFFSLLYYRHI